MSKLGISTVKGFFAKAGEPKVRAVNTIDEKITEEGYYYIEVQSKSTNIIYPLGVIYWHNGSQIRANFGYNTTVFSLNIATDGGTNIVDGDLLDKTDDFKFYISQLGIMED